MAKDITEEQMAKISFNIRKKAIEKWHPIEYNINGYSEAVFI